MGEMLKKIHRRYPDRKWDFRALSLRKNDKDIIYYNLKNGNRNSEGVEVYSGKNYIVGSNQPSHSNRYDVDRVPKTLKNDVEILKKKHKESVWDNSDKYLDEN